MEITVQETPNPNARKYILPTDTFAGACSFPGVESAADDPLASRLFALGGIYNVFWVRDFVTVNKYPDVDWEPLNERIVAVMVDVLKK
jgi:hypothetical protein